MDRTLQPTDGSSKKTKRRTIRIDEGLATWLESKGFNPRVRIESKIEMEKTSPSSSSAFPVQSTQAPTDIKDIVDQLISFFTEGDNYSKKDKFKTTLGIQDVNISGYFQKYIGEKLQDYIYGSAGSSFPIESLLAEMVRTGLLNKSAIGPSVNLSTPEQTNTND